jgi:hypothetical protein
MGKEGDLQQRRVDEFDVGFGRRDTAAPDRPATTKPTRRRIT